MRAPAAVIVIILICFAASCGDSGPTKSDKDLRPLAGGGRLEGDDPADGYADSTGVTYPDILPDHGLIPIYSSFKDCADNPGNVIISDQETWANWWDTVTGCQWRGGDPNGMMHPGDSSWMPDDSLPCGGRCETEPPVVDFENYVVAAIAVEYDSGAFCYRSVWVDAVEEVEGKTTIYYEVSRLDQSCCEMIMAMYIEMGFSPVVAVMIERPVTEEVVWVRSDITHECHGPDPNEPMTVYYTDASCNLGDNEQIITDSASWTAWQNTAFDCEMERWPDTVYYPSDSTVPGDDGTDPNGYPWRPPMMEIDFTTHAVIVLRAGEQTRWGGGIWMTKFERSAAGTTIGYSVMEPADDCPTIDYGPSSINPTVAIRVPLPLDPPIIWERAVESITCDWGNDSTWIEPWPIKDTL